MKEHDVKDFEGRWEGYPSRSGNLEIDCGKCAEYLLWVELAPEKIPLPEDEEDNLLTISARLGESGRKRFCDIT